MQREVKKEMELIEEEERMWGTNLDSEIDSDCARTIAKGVAERVKQRISAKEE